MKRDEVIALLNQHQSEIAAFGLRRFALFGSVARDEAGPDSDVDVLVEFTGDPTFSRYADLWNHLEEILPRRVDLVIGSSIRPALRQGVEEDAYEIQELRLISR